MTANENVHDVLSPARQVIRVGESATFAVDRFDEFDNPVATVTDQYSFAGTGLTCAAATCTASAPGTFQVTATSPELPTLTAEVTVELPDDAYLVISPAQHTVPAGADAAYTAVLHDESGDPVQTVTDQTRFTITEPGTCTARACTSTVAGQYLVTGSYDGLSDEAELTVVAAAVDRIAVSPDGATIEEGEQVAFSVNGFDEFDNGVGDLTEAATFAISGNGTCVVNSCGSEEAGEFTVTASYEVPPAVRTRTGAAAAPAAAPGDLLTAQARLTVRAAVEEEPPGTEPPGTEPPAEEPGDDEPRDDEPRDEPRDEPGTAAPTSARNDDSTTGLPSTGGIVEWWHLLVGLLLVAAGATSLRRGRPALE